MSRSAVDRKALPQTILLVASYADSIVLFRGSLIQALLSNGLAVHVAAPGLVPGHAITNQLERMGVVCHSVRLQRTNTDPIADLRFVFELRNVLRRVRPEVVMGYTVKPVIYGAIAARWVGGIRFAALITGLGYAFTGQNSGKRGLIKSIVQRLYRRALKYADVVFFQNPDDQTTFQELGLISSNSRVVVVNGSGIDLDAFPEAPRPTSAHPVFLLIARLLGDKGVREYAAAARVIRAKYPNVEFKLVGWIDDNPDTITEAELSAWVEEGDVDYLGRLDDVRPVIAGCSVYVLPSYREGTPRTVLEAMSMGRAVITTDAPGCRETTVDGVNGFLVKPQSSQALVEAMERFVLDDSLAERMGVESRRIAEEKYDVHKVNAQMMGWLIPSFSS